MSAETIARAHKGRKVGSSWLCLCPAHADRNPSLAVRDTGDGAVLVRCHAGCAQEQVIAALRAKGLWPTRRRSPRYGAGSPRPQPVNDEGHRSAVALRLWDGTLPPAASPVETYIRWRGITLDFPSALRFYPALKHPSGTTWPGLVALVTNGVTGAPQAIHRSFLVHDGTGKAPVDPQRLMLGPCRGGAVRLAPAENEVLVGEGIETCLAAMQASSKPAWAALSTSGLRSLDLPGSVERVTVLADGDPPGEAAAQDCARRWQKEGRQVRIARPPQGLDFADLLLGRNLRSDEARP